MNASVLSNLATLAYPLLSLLAPGHGVIGRSLHLAALLGFAGLWAGMQRAQIAGGPFMDYLHTLPYTARQLRHADVLVLMLANGPWLLLALGAIAVGIRQHQPLAHLLLLGDVIVLALAAQLAVLARRFASLPALLAACLLLGASFGTRAATVSAVLVAAVTVVALWRGPSASDRPVRRTVGNTRIATGGAATGFGALHLSAALLWRQRRNELAGKLLASALLATGAYSLARLFDGDGRSFPTIVIAQGAIVLVMSGMLRPMHLTHVAAAGYFDALPLRPGRHWWRPFDLALVAACCLPLLAGLSVAAWQIGASTPWHSTASVASYLALLAVLSLPHLYTERHAVVVGAIVTGLWVAVTFVSLT